MTRPTYCRTQRLPAAECQCLRCTPLTRSKPWTLKTTKTIAPAEQHGLAHKVAKPAHTG